MKAPNGKDSNLGEADWLLARTDGFKERFGDWELKYKEVNILETVLFPFKNNAEAKV
jgi:hypothetical protein